MTNNGPHIALFDLDVHGHHVSYLRHLVRYWLGNELRGRLSLIVGPAFADRAADICAMTKTGQLHICPVRPSEYRLWRGLPVAPAAAQPLWRAFYEWRLLNVYSRKVAASHVLAMQIDSMLYGPLALHRPGTGSLVSGIYFSPTFHYQTLGWHRPSARERVKNLRQQICFGAALRHPSLATVFSLDRFFAEDQQQRDSTSRVEYLPDPLDFEAVAAANPDSVRSRLGLGAGRKTALLLGAQTQRKGTEQLLHALMYLDGQEAAQLRVLLVGKIPTSRVRLLASLVGQVRQRTAVEVIVVDEFIPENQVADYFSASDFVLCPYPKHAGMSGIMLWAAAFGKPMLGPRYGLLGQLSHAHDLGVIVDTGSTRSIAQGLQRLIHLPTTDRQRDSMQRFAIAHSKELFCRTIYRAIMPPVGDGETKRNQV